MSTKGHLYIIVAVLVCEMSLAIHAYPNVSWTAGLFLIVKEGLETEMHNNIIGYVF